MTRLPKILISMALLASITMPYGTYAFDLGGFLDAAGKIKNGAGQINSVLNGPIPGRLGGGGGGNEVPVKDQGVRDVQDKIKKKEIGVKRIPLPGIGGINLPFPVPGSSDDSFAWNIANMAIHKISKEVVNWIRDGGKGRGRKGTSGSLFVTNWEDFLKDVANEASGIFIEEFELTELCKPFKPRLQLLLGGSGRAPYYQRARCTIEDVANNVEKFYKDFKKGGWTRWFQITMVPQNNFYGAYYMSLEEKLVRESSALEAQNSMAIAGGGFLGKEECIKYEEREKDEGGNEINPNPFPPKCVKWRTVTPGTLVQDQLKQVFGGDLKRLEVADEIDEIVAAAFQRLFSELRKSQQGVLKGKGTPATPTKPATIDPLEQFIKDTEREVSTAIDQVSKNLELPQAIVLAGQTASVKQDSISKVNSLIDVFENINSCAAGSGDSRIETSEANKTQLGKDIENINTLKTQLEIGVQQLAGAKTTDDVNTLYGELKTAVDIIISLHDSAVAENNGIDGDIAIAKQELETCTNPPNE